MKKCNLILAFSVMLLTYNQTQPNIYNDAKHITKILVKSSLQTINSSPYLITFLTWCYLGMKSDKKSTKKENDSDAVGIIVAAGIMTLLTGPLLESATDSLLRNIK